MGIVVLALALLGATGCAGVVCPAIGWSNGIEVDASAYGDDAFVQLCVDVGCSAGPAEQPTPSSEIGVPFREDDGVFTLSMTTPDEVTVRVYDASGVVLHESDHRLDWTYSADVCGGPSSVGPIVLET